MRTRSSWKVFGEGEFELAVGAVGRFISVAPGTALKEAMGCLVPASVTRPTTVKLRAEV